MVIQTLPDPNVLAQAGLRNSIPQCTPLHHSTKSAIQSDSVPLGLRRTPWNETPQWTHPGGTDSLRGLHVERVQRIRTCRGVMVLTVSKNGQLERELFKSELFVSGHANPLTILSHDVSFLDYASFKKFSFLEKCSSFIDRSPCPKRSTMWTVP